MLLLQCSFKICNLIFYKSLLLVLIGDFIHITPLLVSYSGDVLNASVYLKLLAFIILLVSYFGALVSPCFSYLGSPLISTVVFPSSLKIIYILDGNGHDIDHLSGASWEMQIRTLKQDVPLPHSLEQSETKMSTLEVCIFVKVLIVLKVVSIFKNFLFLF